MTDVECGDWLLGVDVVATQAAYTTIAQGGPESCACAFCRNFVAAREIAYSETVRRFYERLGISPNREAETYEMGPLEDGRRHYEGWHHFKGRILRSASSAVEIAPGFSVWFQKSKSCAEPAFRDAPDVVQVEFMAVLPWLLEQEPYYA